MAEGLRRGEAAGKRRGGTEVVRMTSFSMFFAAPADPGVVPPGLPMPLAEGGAAVFRTTPHSLRVARVASTIVVASAV